MTHSTSEEDALVAAFVIPAKRRRFCDLLANPKRRVKATSALAHFRDLDPRWKVALPGNQHDVASLHRLLRGRGAGDTCHVVSENPDLDGKRSPLEAALEQVVGVGFGTLLSCIPGELAFFEGEGPSDRCILARPRTRRSS